MDTTQPPLIPLPCKKCGIIMRLLTSKTSANPGRKFWKCPACGHFKWADKKAAT